MSEVRAWILLAATTILLVLSVAIFIHVVSGRLDARRVESATGESLYREVMSRVDRDYVTEVDHERLVYAAVRGLVGELDQHSKLYGPGDWEEFQQENRGEMLGVGVEVSAIGADLVIGFVMPGSPAADAGLRAAERFATIAGKPVDATKRFEEAVKDLRGPAGSRVAVAVEPRSGGRRREVLIERRVFDSPTVFARLLDEDPTIGHVRIAACRANTPAQFMHALDELRARGMQRLVLDLRFNRGGSFDAAVEIADQWIADGVIVRTRGRNRFHENRATPPAPLRDLPTVLLANGQTASAAEIIAGALQDFHVTPVVGERTFGKGVVQEVVGFQSWAGGMKLTTAHYFTPAERCIEKLVAPRRDRQKTYGILPDVVVPVEDATRDRILGLLSLMHYEPSVRRDVLARDGRGGALSDDPQLAAGVQLLRGAPVDAPIAAR